jgi:hypothetical protein
MARVCGGPAGDHDPVIVDLGQAAFHVREEDAGVRDFGECPKPPFRVLERLRRALPFCDPFDRGRDVGGKGRNQTLVISGESGMSIHAARAEHADHTIEVDQGNAQRR